MRCAVWAVVVWAGFVGNPPPADATALTMEELRAAVADQLTSIHSLYVAYTITDPESLGSRSHEYVWAHDDARVLYRADYTDSTVGFWTSHDGERAYSVGYSDEREPAALEIKDTVPGDLYIPIKPTKLLGLQIASGTGSLAEAMGAPTAEMQTAEEAGVQRVTVTGFVSNPDPTLLTLHVEFDGRHDYLPRRIDYHAEQNPDWRFAYRVDRFERVPDAATGEDRWFPIEGVYIQETPDYGRQEFPIVVTEVRINEELEKSVFVPEIPDGVAVTDNTREGRGRFYMTGGYRQSDAELNGITRDAVDQLPPVGRWRLFLVCISLIALAAAAVGLRWMSKRKSP